jgi:hypothetical protein
MGEQYCNGCWRTSIWGCGLESCGSGYGPVTGSCEDGHESSTSWAVRLSSGAWHHTAQQIGINVSEEWAPFLRQKILLYSVYGGRRIYRNVFIIVSWEAENLRVHRVTRCIEVRFPARIRNFSVQTGSVAPPVRYLKGNERQRPGSELTMHLHLVKKLGKGGALPPLPFTSSWRAALLSTVQI